MPGPVCYGRGGTEPTITDANLVLGRLNPGNFLGGEMQLDLNAAKRAVAERIAAPLGYGGESGMIQMADGIISIATVIMAGAIRKISVEHGLDPRDFVLFTLRRRRTAALQRTGARTVDSDRRDSTRAGQFLGDRYASGRRAHRYLEDLRRNSQRQDRAGDGRDLSGDGK